MSDNRSNGTLFGCCFRLCSVYILSVPYHLDRIFDYRVPDETDICIGDFVAVPFGGGNRPESALVMSIKKMDNADPSLYKPVSSVLNRELSLSEEGLSLVEFLKDRTFCTAGDAVRAMTPSAAFSKLKNILTCKAPLPQFYPECCTEYKIYEYISSKGECEKSALFSAFGAKKTSLALNTLISEGIIESEISVRDASNIRYKTLYSLAITDDELLLLINNKRFRSHVSIEAMKYLAENRIAEQNELTEAVGVSSAQLRALCERGYLHAQKREIYRIPYKAKGVPKKLGLNEEQKRAADEIINLTRSGKAEASLLFGVTGSGKTHVIRAVTEDVISQGKSVIILVPEISLTPQTISFFSASFGERCAVIHSGLSAGERFDAWRRIKKGEVDICIGTRSAIFAPFKNLGLIVIDEEQEHTYKSDSPPRYNTKDIAAFRCAKHCAVMLLASATPSLESYHKAVTGAYHISTLTGRFGKAKLPETSMIDMRKEGERGNFSLYSSTLTEALKNNLENGKQSILFLNRRGYHSFMSCPSCGTVFTCPHCSVSLTHHYSRFAENGYLSCHYCGYKASPPNECPNCHNTKMRFMGYGTQMAEEQLKKLLPDVRVLRMDADTTQGKFSYDDILGRFRNHEADVLLGTQMVTKGHDFPDVTLVGMLSADQSLYVDDYRANERTFSIICQTVGRTGRAKDEGKAYIQCYSPEHPVLELATAQGFRAFYENEIGMRRSLAFPPFCDIAAVTVTALNESDGFNSANTMLSYIKELISGEYKDVAVQIFGPFEAPLYKLSEKFRVRLVIKTKNSKRFRAMLRKALQMFGSGMPKNITASVDINPSSI